MIYKPKLEFTIVWDICSSLIRDFIRFFFTFDGIGESISDVATGNWKIWKIILHSITIFYD